MCRAHCVVAIGFIESNTQEIAQGFMVFYAKTFFKVFDEILSYFRIWCRCDRAIINIYGNDANFRFMAFDINARIEV